MTLRRAYAPMQPEFDAFLFASLGEEVDGPPLTVLSALARLGVDPRDEAARLTRLGQEAAADQLSRMIARLSERRWSATETHRMAKALVERLPITGVAATDDAAVPGFGRKTGLSGSPFLIHWALALAILVSLIASGYLSFAG